MTEEFKHKITYKMGIVDDELSIEISGESADFKKLTDTAVIRPRHIKLVANIQVLMREFIRLKKD